MEALRIQQWIENGFGGGGGYGYGVGSGEGSGGGSGAGGGSGSGDINMFGVGAGCGDGDGAGDGLGMGEGSGYAYGFGEVDGSGDSGVCIEGIKFFCGMPVYLIDCVPTIITAVFGSYAKGYILKPCLTLMPCYIAKKESYFSHGETLRKAMEAVNEKALANTPEEERISEFWKCHERGVKYPARDLYEWHHRLTGSCEMGRNTFVEEHGIDLNSDMLTVEEFVKLCETSYGGKIIRKLNEDGENE